MEMHTALINEANMSDNDAGDNDLIIEIWNNYMGSLGALGRRFCRRLWGSRGVSWTDRDFNSN